MSSDSLQRFAELLAARPDLQEKARAIHAESTRATAERVARLAGESGFSFTAEEFFVAGKSATAELSESDLQNVAGGAWNPNEVNIGVSLVSFGVLCAALAVVSAARNGNADACQASTR